MKGIQLKTLMALILTIAVSISASACSPKSKDSTAEKAIVQSSIAEAKTTNTEEEKVKNTTLEKDNNLASKTSSDEGKNSTQSSTALKPSTKTNTESNSNKEAVVTPTESKEEPSQKPSGDSEKTPAPDPSTSPNEPPTQTQDGPSGTKIISYATNFLGVKYRWGGTSPVDTNPDPNIDNSGFDASGFVQYVFTHFDIAIGRNTKDQIKIGNSISKEDLREGDIVFFGTDINNPTHVGIYAGNNLFINSPKPGEVVKLSSFTRTDYLAARRVTK